VVSCFRVDFPVKNEDNGHVTLENETNTLSRNVGQHSFSAAAQYRRRREAPLVSYSLNFIMSLVQYDVIRLHIFEAALPLTFSELHGVC
jgi:hypothetical protein